MTLVKRKKWVSPGKGREAAMSALNSKSWESLKTRCPELKELSDQIRDWLNERKGS